MYMVDGGTQSVVVANGLVVESALAKRCSRQITARLRASAQCCRLLVPFCEPHKGCVLRCSLCEVGFFHRRTAAVMQVLLIACKSFYRT